MPEGVQARDGIAQEPHFEAFLVKQDGETAAVTPFLWREHGEAQLHAKRMLRDGLTYILMTRAEFEAWAKKEGRW
jgi:hypothetical protein